jgi:ATP-dependent DNA helicase RecQ
VKASGATFRVQHLFSAVAPLVIGREERETADHPGRWPGLGKPAGPWPEDPDAQLVGNEHLKNCTTFMGEGRSNRMSCEPSSAPETFLPQFGLSAFRPGQREVIDAVLEGSDCLCIMPTGGGKSLCYQLPSLMRSGVTLVVSPLIALMKDQVDALTRLNLRADYINSALSGSEQSARLAHLQSGELDLLYVAPERFRSPRFLEVVRNVPIQLLAVDEAHCISEWGHDFRPDYARLGGFRQRLGNPQTIALTATATEDVRADVIQQLQLHNPRTFVAGFARPNLHYESLDCSSKRDKNNELQRFVSSVEGSGIIYAATRKACQEIAELVRDGQLRRVAVYHAGMQMDDRRIVQDRFMNGDDQIVVATNAFGMGIDKADVRFVVHFHLPGSLEAYYQEAGRAGRDGMPARCLLLYAAADRYIQEFFIDSAFPPRKIIRQVYEYLRQMPEDLLELTQEEVKSTLALTIGTEGVGTCERLLEKCGVLERLEPNRNMAAVRIESDLPTLVDLLSRQAASQRSVLRELEHRVGDRRGELVYFHPHDLSRSLQMPLSAVNRALRELNRLSAVTYVPPFRGRALRIVRRDLDFNQLSIDFEELENRREANRRKLQRVVDYATSRHCRQGLLLAYFGDRSNPACGHCDNCDRGAPAPSHAASAVCADEDPLRLVVLQTLSGVARTHGRFGRQMIAAMLCGSRSAKVLKWKLDELSTFGLLDHLKQNEVGELMDSLIEAQLLEKSDVDRFRPVVRVTSLGWDVMRGHQPLEPPMLSQTLLAKIRRRYKPPARNRQPDKRSSFETSRATTGDRPEYYWSWRLVHDGYPLEDCVEIRGMELPQVLEDLVAAVEDGYPLPSDRVLDADAVKQLAPLVDGRPHPDPTSVAIQLPDSVTELHVRLYLACRAAELSEPD